jgi:hypothetical protein
MKKNTLFITYNPHQVDEQTLAIRLHTIGAANGFRIFLPDRFHSDRILDMETKRRIDESDYFILFSLSHRISPIVADEINYAWQKFKDKRKIVVIYSADMPKSLNSQSSVHCTEIYFNPNKQQMDDVIREIMDAIFKKEAQKKKSSDIESALLALLGIGLGLLVLNEISEK